MIFTGTGNANKILGIPVQTGTPSDTFTLLYDAASRRWIFGPSGTPPAGGVGGGANLTTVGSVPFVTAAGVLGSSSNLTYTVGGSLLLNVSSGNQGVAVVNSGSGATEYIARNSAFGANTAAFGLNSTGAYAFGGATIPLLLFSGGE